MEKFGQAADCFETKGDFSIAAKLYEKAGLISKVLECLE